MIFSMIVIYNLISHLITASNIVEGDTNNSNIIDAVQKVSETSPTIIPSDKWISNVIKDIAYYLRDHKFNEWDRRYYPEKPDENLIGFFGTFPTPPLKSLHWEVKTNCYNNFYRCIIYLHSIIEKVPCLRVEDTVTVINEKNYIENGTIINQIGHEYEENYNYAQKIGLPFDEPIERFQWRTTASYYMCWYTMLGVPALTMIGESCDNYANCWNKDFGGHNHDPRADDKFSFQCAMYSFCPDPCCPIKHIESIAECQNDKRNPCFEENTETDLSKSKCQINRKSNQNFNDIVNNRWNISCNNCKDGFNWKSEFGMCVDVNECLLGINKCDVVTQDCLNLPGTFYCLCKWGFKFDEKKKVCVKINFTIWSEEYHNL